MLVQIQLKIKQIFIIINWDKCVRSHNWTSSSLNLWCLIKKIIEKYSKWFNLLISDDVDEAKTRHAFNWVCYCSGTSKKPIIYSTIGYFHLLLFFVNAHTHTDYVIYSSAGFRSHFNSIFINLKHFLNKPHQW